MYPLALLNTTAITADGFYSLEDISLPFAKNWIQDYQMLNRGIVSYVGHEATAQIMGRLLGIEVPVNRRMFTQRLNQEALCFKLNGRPENGKELSIEELEEIGFSFKLLKKFDLFY